MNLLKYYFRLTVNQEVLRTACKQVLEPSRYLKWRLSRQWVSNFVSSGDWSRAVWHIFTKGQLSASIFRTEDFKHWVSPKPWQICHTSRCDNPVDSNLYSTMNVSQLALKKQ